MSRDEKAYRDARLSPQWGQPEYTFMSDLRILVGKLASNDRLRILDFGSDLSPYRPLFPNSEYVRVDISAESHPDIVVGRDEGLPFVDGTFDLVLSTQVLEHVERPERYLAEASRVLRPGGRLFVSTHGQYEQHGFPDDFHRWTTTGLIRAFENAGFKNCRCFKLTVGPRAGAYQLERVLETTYMRRSTVAGFAHFALRSLHRITRPLLNRIFDAWYRDYRVIDLTVPYQNIYVGVAVLGEVEGSI